MGTAGCGYDWGQWAPGCGLLTADCGLRTVDCWLRTTYYYGLWRCQQSCSRHSHSHSWAAVALGNERVACRNTCLFSLFSLQLLVQVFVTPGQLKQDASTNMLMFKKNIYVSPPNVTSVKEGCFSYIQTIDLNDIIDFCINWN